jgi:hypothetical protein
MKYLCSLQFKLTTWARGPAYKASEKDVLKSKIVNYWRVSSKNPMFCLDRATEYFSQYLSAYPEVSPNAEHNPMAYGALHAVPKFSSGIEMILLDNILSR